ncbi:MAG: NnrU family protein, partial [Gammaproteobacteria bacterium]|nr:NnrU family protein [Gammaproteobacteria bacterium]
MTLLAIGVLLFAGLHLFKSLAPSTRAGLQQRLGENGYKGIFSLLVLGSMALIVLGWRSSVPQFLYSPAPELKVPAL